ncbi:MAG: tRNA (N6-threonylcarbamoyladenosine(37)-N6)-methyltransferase TrmO [Deltaproteobacteria bacterium]|jgi:tRNA-Thr(GGU) m(6)t(6)A37 methyltransferase TsaA|nr:tRNA (N6-threonylcarbamoyladenosine(37)-N6)-methyltransferase TrmO [Deltaproteobacteria bacterium]
MKIEYRPIGIVHSPFSELKGMPIQPSRAKGIAGTVEVFLEFQEGLKDLNGFSHIILLYHFHMVTGYNLQVVPFLDSELRGLFATRAPKRPNPIGLSVVRLEGVQGGVLSVLDLDILDGTPILDIKPYVTEFDKRTNVSIGWLEEARKQKRKTLSDDRFK